MTTEFFLNLYSPETVKNVFLINPDPLIMILNSCNENELFHLFNTVCLTFYAKNNRVASIFVT